MASRLNHGINLRNCYCKEIEDCEKYTESSRHDFCDPDGCGFYDLNGLTIKEHTEEKLVVDWGTDDTFTIKANDEEDVDNWDYRDEYQELKDTIAYGRKVIKKTIRVFQSENPDAEMENNEDDDEE